MISVERSQPDYDTRSQKSKAPSVAYKNNYILNPITGQDQSSLSVKPQDNKSIISQGQNPELLKSQERSMLKSVQEGFSPERLKLQDSTDLIKIIEQLKS